MNDVLTRPPLFVSADALHLHIPTLRGLRGLRPRHNVLLPLAVWDLLVLCLSAFSPSTKLENYLMIFLRKNLQGSELPRYMNAVYGSLYGPSPNMAPDINDLGRVLGTFKGGGEQRAYRVSGRFS